MTTCKTAQATYETAAAGACAAGASAAAAAAIFRPALSTITLGSGSVTVPGGAAPPPVTIRGQGASSAR